MTKHDRKLGSTYVPVRGDDEVVPLGGVAKRLLDICGASFGILLLSPLFLMIAILLKVTDKGPIFYGHKRVGFQGQNFKCWKFRTMVVNSAEVLAAHLATNPDAAAEWAATRKLRRDVRVTDVGAVLRKLSLDELPQLFNVLRGEMSLVGPRPIVWDEMEYYGPAAVFYLRARPGLTGAWQVSGRSDTSYGQRVSTDQHYVENWSLMRDIVIILKTIPVACSARGSY